MRVLGIDPGYAIVGFGALDYEKNRFSVVRYGAITTQSHTQFEDRLEEIYNDTCRVLDVLRPDAMAIETLFFTTNKTTAIAVAEARTGSRPEASRPAEIESVTPPSSAASKLTVSITWSRSSSR